MSNSNTLCFFCTLLTIFGLPDILLSDNTVQTDARISANSFRWEKLEFSGDDLVRAGSEKLPITFKLPPALRPSGNVALVNLYTVPTPRLVVVMFYSAGQEQTLKHWPDNFPKDFPLPAGSFNPQVKLRPYQYGSTWTYSVHAKTAKGNVNISAIVVLKKPADALNEDSKWWPADYKQQYEAMASPESPVKASSHFEYLVVVFDRR